MAFTFATLVEDALYAVRLTQQDYNGDRVRKVNKLLNLLDIGGADASSLQSFYRGYEQISSAGIADASAAQEVAVTGQNTTSTDGNYAKVSDRLVLWFTRAHPLNALKPIWASFIIVAPKDTVVDTGAEAGEPNITEGETLASATTDPEILGAMITYLESAITYTAINGTTYNGGWDYSAQYSRVITAARDVGANPDT